jgi:hypothetical protein
MLCTRYLIVCSVQDTRSYALYEILDLMLCTRYLVNGEFEGTERDTKYDTHEGKRLQYYGAIFEIFILIL